MLDLLTRWTEGESTDVECSNVGPSDGNAADEGFLFGLTGCCNSSRDNGPPLYPPYHGMCFRDEECHRPEGAQTDRSW